MKAVRLSLSKARVTHFLQNQDGDESHIRNFGAMILNRSIDNFDDALFLINAHRYPAACSIARGLIETIAFGYYTLNVARNELMNNGGNSAIETVINHTNSSFFKVDQQKLLKKGLIKIDDYHFTEEAKKRMLSGEAGSVKITKALSEMFKDERGESGQSESQFELIYKVLCEWTHPSQMSLLTYYSEDGQATATSDGPLDAKQAAKLHCVLGLEIIHCLPALYSDLNALAARVTAADR